MAGLLSKGVTLSMVAYASSPTFTDSDVVADLQEFPDILGEPENVDVTTLADSYRHYIPGIRDVGGSMGFTFLYSKALFGTFNSAVDVHKSFQLKFPDGMTITWGGYVTPSIIGKGVNDALQFTANITADTDFTIGGIS